MVRIILAKDVNDALSFCRKHELTLGKDAYIIESIRSIEGLRFRYEDVVRVPGWSYRPDIEDIEERILRAHVMMAPKRE